MKRSVSTRSMTLSLLCGMLGCILMASGDWLMIYGDTAFEGSLAWLTVGVAQIAPWRNSLAMMVAFPAVICYSVALFAIRYFLPRRRERSAYTALTAIGLTPWLCLHLLYTMILFLFAWMTRQGQNALGLRACEALFAQFSWLVPTADVLMLLPYLYLLVVTLKKRTVMPPTMALNNPLLLFVILKLITGLLPDTPFRLGFLNGLMSESMLIWFLIFLLWTRHTREHFDRDPQY